jgi:hypothetical protein
MLGLAVGAAGPVKADSITTFIAEGTFLDGATLGGTVTIDTTIGSVTAVNLTIGAPDSLDLTAIVLQQANFPVSGIYFLEVNTGGPTYPGLSLGMPVSTLDGYSGGSLISDSQPGPSGYASALYLSATNTVQLDEGSLSTVAEPSSAVLAALGAVAFSAYGWCRHRRAKRKLAAA